MGFTWGVIEHEMLNHRGEGCIGDGEASRVHGVFECLISQLFPYVKFEADGYTGRFVA